MVEFIGGPLDGRSFSAQVAQAQAQGYNDLYGQVVYTRGGDGNYHWTAPTGGGPTGVEALGVRGPQGWADLRRTIGGTVPTYTRKTQILARATRRRIATRRRHR